MPAGRPKKTCDDLPKKWKAEALMLYEQGASDVEVMCKLDMSNDWFYRMVKEDEEFSETIKKGRKFAQSWWEAKGRCNMENHKFNYTGWYMNMKNRYKWADRQENKDEVDQKMEISWKQ